MFAHAVSVRERYSALSDTVQIPDGYKQSASAGCFFRERFVYLLQIYFICLTFVLQCIKQIKIVLHFRALYVILNMIC